MDEDHNQAFLKRHGLAEPMCGCDVGKGWIPLLDELVTDLIALGWDKDLHQVKEKFGGLRFYIGDASEEVHKRISETESVSFGICEQCGEPAGQITPRGWIMTLCQECRKDKNK